MMTIQDRIDEVVQLVEGVVKGAAIPEGDKERIVESVKDLGFQWQKSNAHGRAACIILGLLAENFPTHMRAQFVRECVTLKQWNELAKKEAAGSVLAFKTVPLPLYAALIDLLMVQAIEGKAGVYLERDVEDPDGTDQDPSPTAKNDTGESDRVDTVAVATVEIVDKVPDVPGEVYTPGSAAGKSETDPADKIKLMTREEHADLHSAGRKNGPGVKTAEKIRKATNAPVKKAGATRKTSGAADGK